MSEETSLTEESVVEDVAPDQETDPVATLTSDLQRLQAEYANYRKRVERDRSLAHEMAIGAVLTELLALLDDVDRAETHGELTGGFKAVADQLNTIVSRIGLEKYGTDGEVFDPQVALIRSLLSFIYTSSNARHFCVSLMSRSLI